MPVLMVVTAAAAWAVADRGEVYVLTAVSVISAYTVASHKRRTTAWIAGAAAAFVVYAAAVGFGGQGWDSSEALEDLAWMGMAVAIGDAVRSRRAYVAAIEERAVRAEQSRDDEARRQVAEERLRIARELHDIVAHHVALINVQAEVAAHTLRPRPEQAEQALTHIRQAVRTVLAELSTVLTVLRRNDPEAGTEPTPGLDRLAGLLNSLAASGLRVAHHQDGPARPPRTQLHHHRTHHHRRQPPRCPERRDRPQWTRLDRDAGAGQVAGRTPRRRRQRGRPIHGTGIPARATSPEGIAVTKRIRVLLADDQALIRAGFRVLIESAPDLKSSAKRPTAVKRSRWPVAPEPT